MGVKDLWSVLSPSCEKKSLWELQGLAVAIDLSSWIVDSQTIGDNSVMNMYLRNLFFRTSYLLLLGVKPIFILEGKAPVLKHDTIARRNQALKENQIPSKNKNGNRGRLNCLQKKCEDLLLSMGVKCYKSEGEAEALCSRLNEVGIVDAVISQDSDCFLYGAKVVLRNFTMSPAYTCDMYTMKNIEEKLCLGRQKLLALSLLCGCDYDKGVHGVGKQSALNFLATLSDDQVLDRLRSWRSDDFSDNLTQMSTEEKLELNIRKKAILDPSFPSEEVISEFMLAKSMDLPSFVWLKPSLPTFIALADRLLAWEDDYICSKFMPLVTRWHLLHGGASCGLKLENIIKKRSVRGVPSYELRWHHDGLGEVTTIEPSELVAQVYSELHEAYLKSKEKPRKGQGRKKKTKTSEDGDVDDAENLMRKLDICSHKVKQPNNKRNKIKTTKGIQTLDRFVLTGIPSNKTNQEDGMDDVENLMGKLDISSEQIKQPNKKRSKIKNTKGLQTLDRFVLTGIPTNNITKEDGVQEDVILHSTPIGTPTGKINMTKSYHYLSGDGSSVGSPLRKKNIDKKPVKKTTDDDEVQLSNLDFLSFADSTLDCSELDLSNIVNSIVGRTSNNPAVKIWAEKLS